MRLSRRSIERLLGLAAMDKYPRTLDDTRFLRRCQGALLPAEKKASPGRGSRTKGQAGEREAAAFLAEQGFPEARRGLGQARGGGKEVADCINVGPLHIEVKRVEKLNVVDAVKQAQRDAGENKIPLVLHRRNNHPWLVTMPAEEFFAVFRESEHCLGGPIVYDPTQDVEKEENDECPTSPRS